MQKIELRLAEKRDASELLCLINLAYRQEHDQSWTNELGIVSGDRINQEQLDDLIKQTHLIPENQSDSFSQLMVATINSNGAEDILGCILLDFIQDDVEIGTFCISPKWQNLGYGQQLLNKAEVFALKIRPKLYSYMMWVLNVRLELIDYYLRRGYIKTGKNSDYPLEARVGQPLVKVHLIQLQKQA